MDFGQWLKEALKERKIDIVYQNYLLSILEDDDVDDEEKRESVSDIIASLIVSFQFLAV